jgi:hypothetical protein
MRLKVDLKDPREEGRGMGKPRRCPGQKTTTALTTTYPQVVRGFQGRGRGQDSRSKRGGKATLIPMAYIRWTVLPVREKVGGARRRSSASPGRR